MSNKLYDFQREGVEFLLSELPETGARHHVLGDDTGAGKMVQGAAAIQELRNRNWADPSALIFCPVSIKDTWKKYLVDWGGYTPETIFVVKKGSDVIPETAKAVILNYEYAIVKNIYDQLLKRWFTVFIADECHRLKSLKSKRTSKILGNRGNPICARGLFKFGFSATWMPNHPVELYPMLKVWAPQIIAPHTDFDDYGRYFCDGYLEDFGGYNFTGASNIDELKERIKPFYLRREIDDVIDQLPPVVVENIYFDVGEMPEDESNTPLATLRKAVGDKKLPYAIEYIKDRLTDAPDEKLLVFTYHRSISEGIVAALPIDCLLVYGGVSAAVRRQAIDEFITNKDKRILVAQINSAGEGIDGLQNVCNNMIAVELDWSSGLEDQLIGRLRRIGQKKIVKYTRLIADGTLDNPMHGTLKKKRKVSQALFGTDKQKENEMSIEQTLEQIRVGIEKNNELLEKAVGLLGKSELSSAEVADTTKNGATASETSEPGKPKVGRPKAEVQKAKVDPTTTPTPATQDTASPATLEDLQKACQKHLKDSGKSEADARKDIIGVFQTFGASSIKDLPKENYGEAIEQIGNLAAVDPLFG